VDNRGLSRKEVDPICTNCGVDYVDEHVTHEILTLAERNREERGNGRCARVTFSALLYRVNRFSFLVGSRINPRPRGSPTGAQIPKNPGSGNRPGQAMTVGCCIGPGCRKSGGFMNHNKTGKDSDRFLHRRNGSIHDAH
jgi:hypothetical protein